MTQPPASLMSQEEGFRGTHGDSFSPSLSPNMCAEHQAGWLKHCQSYTRCPKSTKHTSDTAHGCQQHPVLPSDDLSYSANHWTDYREYKVACGKCPPPLRGFSGNGRERQKYNSSSGAWCWAPCSPQGLNFSVGPWLMSHSGHGRTESELPLQRLFCSISV